MFEYEITSISKLFENFPDEQACIDYLEKMRWDGNPVSPFDKTSKVYKRKNNRYKCKNTDRYFSVKTHTMYENTKIRLKDWFGAIWLITANKKGVSSTQLATQLDVTQATAWFMLSRIRKCFGIENNSMLEGIVEADETFVGGKNKNRHKDKKFEKARGRSFKDKTPVLGLLQRKGKLTSIVIPNTQKLTIQTLVKKYVKPGSTLFTDEWQAYDGLKLKYQHSFVNHAKKEYVDLDNPLKHSNTIEGFWSIFKRGMTGVYNHTSKKHLQLYVDEFVYRYNTREYTQSDRFNWLLLNSNVRTKYKDLIYENIINTKPNK